jgi:hypothetical protein
MSLSKTQAKKKEQVREVVVPTQGVDQGTGSQSASGDVATLNSSAEEQANTSSASINGQSVGPLRLEGTESASTGDDVGGDMGDGGFYGWLGSLFDWGGSSTSSASTPSVSSAGSSASPVAAASDMSTVSDPTYSVAGFEEVVETRSANEAGFEEEEWIRDEETEYLNYDKKQRSKYTGSDGSTRTVTSQQSDSSDFGRHSSVNSDIGAFSDKEKDVKVSGTNKAGSDYRVDETRTVGGTTYNDHWKVGGELALTKDGDTKTASTTARGGVGSRVTTADADGNKTTLTSDHDFSVTGESIKGKKDDQATQDYGVSAGYGYTSGEMVERTLEDGTKVLDKTESGVRGDVGYRTDKGVGGSLTFSDKTGERHTGEDGTLITTSGETKATTVSADREGVGVRRKVTNTAHEEVDKLGKNTRLTTTTGKTEAEAGAKAGKDADGNWYAEADAAAKASLYEQKIQHKWDGGGGEAEASWNALSAEGKAKGRATLTSDAIKVGGNASAKATLIGGNARIEAPAFGWKMLGEDVDVAVTAGVSAAVLAEAEGNIDLDISKGEDLGIEMGGGGKAFAGAKAGVEVGAKLRWRRQPDYTDLLMNFAKSIPGSLDDYFVDKLPREAWTEIGHVLVGGGKSDLLSAKAGVEGSAGIGGEAKFGGTLKGGKINVSGTMSGTVGLGAGVHTDLMLDAINGVRFAGVLFMRGTEWLKEALKEAKDWYDQAVDLIQLKIDEYMEAEKAEGGWSGALATAVDWVGDDLFDLW